MNILLIGLGLAYTGEKISEKVTAVANKVYQVYDGIQEKRFAKQMQKKDEERQEQLKMYMERAQKIKEKYNIK